MIYYYVLIYTNYRGIQICKNPKIIKNNCFYYKSSKNNLYELILYRNIIYTYILKIIKKIYRVLTHTSEILLWTNK